MERRKSTSAFTLVECLIALAILGIAIGAIVTPIEITIQQKARAAKQTVAVLLAEQLIEECVAHDLWSYDAEWPSLGPTSEEPWRNAYDEISDYHNVKETPGQFGTIHGVRLSAADFAPNLTRRVWAQYFYLPGEYTAYTYDFMMLTVRVYDGDEELVTLRRVIWNDDHTLP
mgnify:CR=1 FL=1